MNNLTKSIRSLFSRSVRPAAARPERVSGMGMQEQHFTILPDSSEKVPTGKVMNEIAICGCRQSEAATTVFVP